MTTPFPPRPSLDSYLAALPAGALAGVPDLAGDCVLVRWLWTCGYPDAMVCLGRWSPTGWAAWQPVPAWAAVYENALLDVTRSGRSITAGRARAVLAGVGERVEEVAVNV